MSKQRYLVDTNILILLFNARLAEPLPEGQLICSIITEMELRSFPALTPSEEDAIRTYLSSISVCAIDDAVKEEAIRLRRSNRLKLPDAIIAATAVVNGATLVTNDVTLHGVPGLPYQSLTLK